MLAIDDTSEVGLYNIKVNLLWITVIAVPFSLLAAAASVTYVQPVGSFIAGTLEIASIDEGF